jgi:Putative auto-transporter adhesin, head GIN domain
MRALAIFSFLLFGIAASGYSQHTIHGDGSDVTVNRSISSFEHLHNSISAQVTVTKGDKYEVKIEGEANVIEALVTEVKDGELNIHFPSFTNIQSTRSLRIVVTTPGTLSEVSNSGSGGIRTESVFKTGEIRVHNSGSGGIALELEADHIDVSMSGSGNIQIKGSANQVECNISGSGSIRASDLAVKQHSEIHVSGSGSCSITTDGIIDGSISGSGGINYSGNPSEVNVSHSGSGRAHKV